MTANREPTADELNGVKQDTVQWPAKAHRVTNTDSDGNEITDLNPFNVTLPDQIKDVDDNAIAKSQILPTIIPLNYGFDSSADFWSRFLVETDNDSIPAGQNPQLVINLPYYYEAKSQVWKRWQGEEGAMWTTVVGLYTPTFDPITDDDLDALKTVNASEFVDDTEFTPGTDRGLAIGGIATSDSVNPNDFGVLKITTDRSLVVTNDAITDSSQKTQITDGTDDGAVVENTDDDTNLDGVNGLVVNGVLYGRIDADTIKPIRIDGSTHSIQTIEYEHHEIHAGSSFTVCDVQNVNGTTIKYQVTTPAGAKYAHMLFNIAATGETLVLVTEGSDRVDGTALDEINRRRVGTPTVAGVIVTRTPTGGLTDGAITIMAYRSGSTGVGSKTVAAGGERGTNEYVLKPSTKYVVSIQTFADIYVTFRVDWYEHQDKS